MSIMSKYFHLNIVLLIKASLPEATFQKICLLSLYLCWMGTLLLLEVCYFEMVSVSGKFQEILAQELSPRSFDLRQPFSLKLEESRSSFAQFFTKITVVIVIILFLQILQQYFIESIYLSTRTNVTLFFFRRYLAQSPSHGSLLDDSLDQRLSADLELFSRSLVTLFPHVSIWPLSVSYYLYLNFKAMNWYGTFAIITHFGLSSAVISCLSSKISTLTVLQLKYSGNFRSLITIIHRKFEANFLENSLTALQRWATLVFFQWHATYKNFIGWKCLLTGSLAFTQYSGSVLIYFLLGFLLLTGRMAPPGPEGIGSFISTQISISMMFLYKVESLNLISEDFASFFGISSRLLPLLEFTPLQPSFQKDQVGICISVDRFTLTVGTCHPGTLLIHSVSFILLEGENLLIEGPSGVGKTSLLKALLFPESQLFFKFKNEPLNYFFFTHDVSFLPFTNSLLDQLFYPRTCQDYQLLFGATMPSLETIQFCLETAGLSLERHTNFLEVDRLAAYKSTSISLNIQGLSNGEKQRFLMTRIILWRPRLVILDEAFSSLELNTQSSFYGLLDRFSIQFITTMHLQTAAIVLTHFPHLRTLQIKEDKHAVYF